MVKHHGVPFLEKKQKELVVNKSNINDIKEILGTPSTTSKFDNDIWIYIERKQTQSKLKNLGKMKIYRNDVLVLEIDKAKKQIPLPHPNQEISEAITQNYWQALSLGDYYELIKTKIDYGLADQCMPLELAVWRHRSYASGFRSPKFSANALMLWYESASEKEIESFKMLRECAWARVVELAQKSLKS